MIAGQIFPEADADQLGEVAPLEKYTQLAGSKGWRVDSLRALCHGWPEAWGISRYIYIFPPI